MALREPPPAVRIQEGHPAGRRRRAGLGLLFTSDSFHRRWTEPPTATADIIAHPLGSFRRLLVASPAYLRRRGQPKTPEALAKHDALTYTAPGFADAWTLIDEGRQATVRLNVVFRSTSPHAVRELAIAGTGIGLLPEWFVVDQARSDALRVVLPAWRGPQVNVYAIHRTEHRGTRAVRALVEHLRAAYLSASQTLSRDG